MKPRYKYTYIMFTTPCEAMNELLNKYTDNSWEVVNFTETVSDTDIPPRQTKVWLKRKTK